MVTIIKKYDYCAIFYIFVETNKWGEVESKWSGEQIQLHEFVSEWEAVGFTWIGGCCRITPQQISMIANVRNKL